MTKLNVEKYKKRLLAERQDIIHDLEMIEDQITNADTGDGHSELADYDNHPADEATETFEKEKDLAIRDARRETMSRIDEALDKIERDTYGLCDRCGREIGAGRLDAVPYAIFCIQCQDAVEGN